MDQRTCSVEGCDGAYYGRSWCRRHYKTWRRWGDPLGKAVRRADVRCASDGCDRMGGEPGSGWGFCSRHYQDAKRREAGVQERKRRTCTIEDCNLVRVGFGYCSKHYTLLLRYGDPLVRLRGVVIDGCRICPSCGEDKPLAQWAKGECRTCSARRAAARRLLNPEQGWKDNAARRARLLGAFDERFDRNQIFVRDDWTCRLCGQQLDRDATWPAPLSATIDHIIPLSRGGRHSRQNTQAAHLFCNLSKGPRMAS